ncbi:4-hydroxybenzoate octaprenyltransferase [Sphingomonas morindae]|uniref:4-hydroxybenzoate octaprenyltransferase n=1 Tax=Sphingomonas morindae TaxID=1541170 RepID=A0ABY4X485_9SPHN|nr:4-hydroxybenzoate octaprenyltransferase [Sphingomonas morindae]USI71657.1 4-hydroxybenzoate octaprenyltransferase [Sphingomonas morindae]
MITADPAVPDSEAAGLLGRLPAGARPYALLARFDRPIGAWLLFWPGAWAVLLAAPAWPRAVALLALLGLGAVAMRGAGCVYNDIVDRDLDRRVERTRQRPLASGALGLRQAWLFLLGLCLVGLGVLLCLPLPAQLIALASLAPVACYPFMKRITWWPQAWLGLVFSWAALVGWPAATGRLAAPALWLYAGGIAWVIGYDTIYALQDIEDDALAGVKSSARAMGAHVRGGVALCYGAALLCWGLALWSRRPGALAPVALLPAAAHLGWQLRTLVPDSAENALRRFRANRETGLLVAFAAGLIGVAG